jgi:hypothetical protein
MTPALSRRVGSCGCARAQIVHHKRRRIARDTNFGCESAARDSRKKPVLASADEARRRWARKFFYCQNSRLRVHAIGSLAVSAMRDDVRGKSIVECVVCGNTCGTSISCDIDSLRCLFSRAVRMLARLVCGVVDQRSSRALALARQHFLKRDAVFFNVLVYSGCSAFRFPSARSD